MNITISEILQKAIDATFSEHLHRYNAVVIGCGGSGFYTALFHLLTACADISIKLVDYDRYESKNLMRNPVPINVIEKPKVEYLYYYLCKLRPHFKIEAYKRRIENIDDVHILLTDTAYGDVIVYDCVDSPMISHVIKEAVKVFTEKHRVHYTAVKYDGNLITVDSFPADLEESSGMWVLDNDTHYRLGSTPLSAALAASLAIYVTIRSRRERRRILVNLDLSRLL